MWIFSTIGFFSVVCVNDDPATVKVRSREREHLQALKDTFDLTEKILESTDTDYRFRIILAQEKWVSVMQSLVEQIDYTNFKDAVYSLQGGSKYERALHEVWATMYRTQESS